MKTLTVVVVSVSFIFLAFTNDLSSDSTSFDKTNPVLQDDEICTKFYGNYELKNLYVFNPLKEDSTYCITRAPEVNGEITTKINNTNTFEIRFDELNLKLGDPLIICIYHSPQCKPQLVNPEVIDPKN